MKNKEELHKSFAIELFTPKQVMQAFLAGEKLAHNYYCNGWQNDLSKEAEHYLYLSDSGYICEEDGAQAKTDRVLQINMRNDERWWIVK